MPPIRYPPNIICSPLGFGFPKARRINNTRPSFKITARKRVMKGHKFTFTMPLEQYEEPHEASKEEPLEEPMDEEPSEEPMEEEPLEEPIEKELSEEPHEDLPEEEVDSDLVSDSRSSYVTLMDGKPSIFKPSYVIEIANDSLNSLVERRRTQGSWRANRRKFEAPYEYETGKKKLEDILIVRDFPKVFLEDLSGLPPPQQVDFHINLIP
nr:hypothetical protein [Tanacetum cinerariifolium]